MNNHVNKIFQPLLDSICPPIKYMDAPPKTAQDYGYSWAETHGSENIRLNREENGHD